MIHEIDFFSRSRMKYMYFCESNVDSGHLNWQMQFSLLNSEVEN